MPHEYWARGYAESTLPKLGLRVRVPSPAERNSGPTNSFSANEQVSTKPAQLQMSVWPPSERLVATRPVRGPWRAASCRVYLGIVGSRSGVDNVLGRTVA
jgi:hypothetical protein